MIIIDNLSRKYGSTLAVDHISFVAEAGRVTGFLGPNGAGKSTTMRMMVGLTKPTTGTTTISGRRFADLPNPGLEVGVMLDASAQHPGRTGREVLRVAAISVGVSRTRVEEVLTLVGLTDEEAGRRVRNYSLGMRQRLGIAAALLGEPQVLVLDEPANGLDPQGIHWMRGLLRRFADGGGTVLLSSHLLHEVEQIADEMILIGNGRIVARGTREELLKDATGGVTTTLVTALDNHELSSALAAKGLAVSPAGGGLRVTAEPVDVGRVEPVSVEKRGDRGPAQRGQLQPARTG